MAAESRNFGHKETKATNSPKPSVSEKKDSETVAQYLKGIVCLIVEQGLGKTRAAILTTQLKKHGGGETSCGKLDKNTTHVLVGNTVKLEKLSKILNVKDSTVCNDAEIVRADWLSSCLKEGRLVDVSPYRLQEKRRNDALCGKREDSLASDSYNKEIPTTSDDGRKHDRECEESEECEINNTICETIKVNRKRNREIHKDESSDSDYINSDNEKSEELYSSEDDVMLTEIAPHISPQKKGNTWVCTKPSSSKQENLNEHITQKLEVLEKVYRNTNDHWRALGYKKAITSIKNYPKKIKTVEECQSLPFVGDRLAKKMWEIIQTGNLQRLEHLDSTTDSIDLFCNLWGAGPKAAENWVTKGLKTLEDLKEHGNLNRQQLIGLKYYNEFLDRMPRAEAEEIGKVVTEATQLIDPGLLSVVCGSFRRGRPTCGDVDVLVSHPDGCSHKDVMPQLLKRLKETGFFTDDLTLMDNQNQRKYLGVCMLPGDNRKHRRIDIIVVPYSEWVCSLVYFTGSDYLNRSMRLLARKKGMSLSEHSLNTGVVRQGQERLAEGTPLPVSSEKDIFQYLGLDYLEPYDRDW